MIKAAGVKANNIPKQLKDIPSWLVWKFVPSQTPGKKPRKVPYFVNGRRRKGAITERPSSELTTFEKARNTYLNGDYDGIGFAAYPSYDLTMIDLDGCIDENGAVSEFAQQVIDSGTYVEISPSGRGLRAVYTGGAVIPSKADENIENGERVELYCGGAFVTITGNVYGGVARPVIDLPSSLKRTLSPVIDAGNKVRTSATASSDDEGDLVHPDAAPLRDFTPDHARRVLAKLPSRWGAPETATWYQVAGALHLQFEGSEEAYAVLDEWSQGLDGYDEKGNRDRWEKFRHSNKGGSLKTMRNLVFEATKNGTFRPKQEIMEKWGLSRPADKDFDNEEEIVSVGGPGLPDYKDLLEMFSIRKKLETEPEPIDWLVENFIARGFVSVLAGGSGTSKSYMTMQMCSYGAVGIEEAFGMKLKEGGFKTMYLAYEDGDNSMHIRINALKRHMLQSFDANRERDFDDEGELIDDMGPDEGVGMDGDDGHVEPMYEGALLDKWADNFLLGTSEELDSGAWSLLKRSEKWSEAKKTELHEYLIKLITDEQIDLIVFDTASETHEAEENSTTDMVALMRLFRQIAVSAVCAVLIVQHIQKGAIVNSLDEINQANVRGSSAFVDKARNVKMLARMPKADAPKYGLAADDWTHDNIIAVKHVKANLGEYSPMTFMERTGTGILAYRESIKLLDMSPVDDSKEEDQQNRNRMKAQNDKDQVVAMVRRENENEHYPKSMFLRTQLNAQSGLSEGRVRSAIKSLEYDGRLKMDEEGGYFVSEPTDD